MTESERKELSEKLRTLQQVLHKQLMASIMPNGREAYYREFCERFGIGDDVD